MCIRDSGMPTTLEELDVHEEDIEKMIPTLKANKGCLLYTSRCV